MKKPKNQKYELIDGNTAAAWGARLSRAQVVPNFPITPQTEIIETLAQWKANGIWNGEFVPMECYDEKTEILTEDGWKRFKDLTKNDLIATLNPNTEKLEYRKPNRIIKYRYKGKMYHLKTKRLDICVTPNHKMWVKKQGKASFEFIEASKIYHKSNVKYKKNAIWKGKEQKWFIPPEIKWDNQDVRGRNGAKTNERIKMDDFLEFLGYFISEGSTTHSNRSNYVISIGQKYGTENYKKIKNCLSKLPFNFKYYNKEFKRTNKQLYQYLSILGKAEHKHIPKEIKKLSSRQLKILFDALMIGDGRYDGKVYFTSSKRLADDILEILLKIGISGSIGEMKSKNIKWKDRFFVYVNKDFKNAIVKNFSYKYNDKFEEYDGFVHCVDVTNHIVYVRRNGKVVWCGNSEHSVLSAAIASEASGARTFTASSSQGLLLMHEMHYIASGMRMPIVMANCSRGLSAPITLWSDHSDILAIRDAGWIMFFAKDNQEVLDLIIQSYKIAEDRDVLLPAIVNMEGFTLSYTREPAEIPEQETADRFLPPYKPKVFLDINKPMVLGCPVMNEYMSFKAQQRKAMMNAEEKINEAFADFEKLTGRKYSKLEEHRTEDAETVFVSLGSNSTIIQSAVDSMRKRKQKVGLLRILCYRPFPGEEIKKALKNAEKIIVVDNDISTGYGGIIYPEIKAAVSDSSKKFINVIVSLGGKFISRKDFEGIAKKAVYGKAERYWYM